MKKYIKITALLIGTCFLNIESFSQKGDMKLTTSYNVSFATGDLKGLTKSVSPRGADFSLLYGVTDQLALGLNTGFQSFYKKFPRQVYHLDDGSDVSAVISNSIQTIPLLATAQYKFMPGARIQPYVSAGLGGTIVLFDQYQGEFASSDNKFGFAARPEVGIYMPFSKSSFSGINLGAGYNYVSYKNGAIKDLNSFGIKLGVQFPLRN